MESKRQFVIANQLLKSGTSIGANVFEAQYSESRVDFIHKMKIALKEANETLYWLTLCQQMDDMAVNQEIFKDLKEIMSDTFQNNYHKQKKSKLKCRLHTK